MDVKRMQVSFPGGKAVDAAWGVGGGFTVHTDQPEDKGAAGAAPAPAPNPFELFLASMATCMGFYALSFLQGRDLATDDAGVDVAFHWDPEAKRLARVEVALRLPGGFPEKYRRAIVKAVEGCTVKRTLESPPEFEIVVAE